MEQVVILAGGKGTRMREMTEDLPKPMVPIGGMPVLDHLIKIFEKQGNFKFIICTGYLGGKIEEHYKERKNVKVVFTGDETETGGRLFKVKDLLEENFLFTYGDGLANVNIKKLIEIFSKIFDRKGKQNFQKRVEALGKDGMNEIIEVQKVLEFMRQESTRSFVAPKS